MELVVLYYTLCKTNYDNIYVSIVKNTNNNNCPNNIILLVVSIKCLVFATDNPKKIANNSDPNNCDPNNCDPNNCDPNNCDPYN